MASPPGGHDVSTVEKFLVPETLQGPYADFYRRAIAELVYWRVQSDGDDYRAEMNIAPIDSLAFDSIGIQTGEA